MIRTINIKEITTNTKEMCIEANHFLSEDMERAMKQAEKTEQSPLGKQILEQLEENLQIAADDMIPICQDTGMAVIFLEIGQDVHLQGGSLEDAVNEGVRQGYCLLIIKLPPFFWRCCRLCFGGTPVVKAVFPVPALPSGQHLSFLLFSFLFGLPYGRRAVTSISTRASLGSLATSTAERAG